MCMKGVILKINSSARFIDITHCCPAQDIYSAAYIIRNSDYFPENTIHVVVVDPGVGSSRTPLILKLSNNQIYVLPDNGLITHLLDKYSLIAAYAIENPKFLASKKSNTFHGRDVFAPAAAYASLGVQLHEFGPSVAQLQRLQISPIIFENNKILGQIVYIDSFGNLLSNIHKDQILQSIDCI